MPKMHLDFLNIHAKIVIKLLHVGQLCSIVPCNVARVALDARATKREIDDGKTLE